MQPTEDWRTDVYVQFVATYVTEPTTSYMVLRYNGVNVNISRLEHATLPNGAKVPMEQHFTCLYFRIYRRTPATYVESKSNMLTFAMHAIHIHRVVRRTACLRSDVRPDVTLITGSSTSRPAPSDEYAYASEEH